MSIHVSFFLILINLRDYRSILLKGKRAQDGQFPWLIQFQTVAPCGGVLLSPDWVLTAAQCVQDKRNSIILFATGLNGSDSKQTVPVKATYIYPVYQAYSALPDRDYNIALLKLTKPFDTCPNEIILPGIVPVKYDDNYKLCLIFGWKSYVSPSSKVLAKPMQYHEVILNSWKMCTYMIKSSANYTNVFCAMAELKDDMKACAGNPGSPVVCKNENHETALVGIASWTNFSLECGDVPTYLDLDAFRIWIDGLVFNKDDEESKYNNSSNQGNCRNNANIRNDSWNGFDILQLDSQRNYSSENTETQLYNVSRAIINRQFAKNPHSWNKFYDSIANRFNDTDVSSLDHRHETYTAMAKQPSNSIYKYEEIGVSRTNNQITNDKNEQSSANDSLSCKNKKLDKNMIKYDKDRIDMDDLEILLPFNLEDIIASNSNMPTIYSKTLYMLFHFVFSYFYIIIYM